MTIFNFQLRSDRGFSLIELLVSMAIFTVVLTMAVGGLLVLISSNAKAQNIQEAVSNVQFALDSMAREIRNGSSYYCTDSGSVSDGDYSAVQDCDDGNALSVIEGGVNQELGISQSANSRIGWRYNSSAQSVERWDGGGAWERLTSSKVSITEMYFRVIHTSKSDQRQPMVTIYIKGEVTGINDTGSEFTLQTSLTQRQLDLSI